MQVAPSPSRSSSLFDAVVAAIRVARRGELPAVIEPHHRFLDDLGFDSLALATLALAIEDRVGQVVLLDGWIAEHASPEDLSVESLCEYVGRAMGGDRARG